MSTKDRADVAKHFETFSESFEKNGTTKKEVLEAFDKAPPGMRATMTATARAGLAKHAETKDDGPLVGSLGKLGLKGFADGDSKDAGIKNFLENFWLSMESMLTPQGFDKQRFIDAGLQTANDLAAKASG